METKTFTLTGRHVRLEPLERHHVDALVAAAQVDPSLYHWSPVPRDKAQGVAYVEAALAWRAAGTAAPFAIIRLPQGGKEGKEGKEEVIGSSRFFDLEHWAWPPGHPRHGRAYPDACEIGYTWYTRSAIRTAANTEAKLLMLAHAFEQWQALRVCFHADARNQRSRAALERIGGKFEGILRSHRMAADFIARDSARYSIIAAEWPEVKSRLSEFLKNTPAQRSLVVAWKQAQ